MFIGVGLPMTAPRSSTMPAAYSAEALQFFARVPSVTDVYTKNVISNFIDGLISDGLWGVSDVMHIQGLLPNNTAARQNLFNSNFTLTPIGNPTLISYRGFQGNGAAYLRMNYNPATQAVNASQNSLSMFTFIIGEAPDSSNSAVFGATNQGSSSATIAVGYNNPASGGVVARTNSVFGNQVNGIKSTGSFLANRDGQNSTQIRANDVVINNGIDASTPPINLPFYLLTSNYNGNPYGTSGHLVAIDWVGGSLTPAQRTALHNHSVVALTAVGAI